LQDLVADESFRPMALTVEELDVRVCTGDAVEFVGVAVMVRAEVARALREHGRGGAGSVSRAWYTKYARRTLNVVRRGR